ncbi:hypothetical protein ALQ60_05470 [Pseudomonas syringae pv. papulans]|nr:hypothetical protein ALQ60_05470 [Pseudomonas syringae pv. papulans]
MRDRTGEGLGHQVQAIGDISHFVLADDRYACTQIALAQTAGDAQQAVDGQAQGTVNAAERVEQQQTHDHTHGNDYLALQHQGVVARIQFILKRSLNFVLSLIESRDNPVAARAQRLPLLHRKLCALYVRVQVAAKAVHRCSSGSDRVIDARCELWRTALEQSNTLLQLGPKLQFDLQQALERAAHGYTQPLAGHQTCRDAADLTGNVDFPGHTNGAQINQKQRGVIFVQHHARGSRDVVDKVECLGQLLIPLGEHVILREAWLDTVHQGTGAFTQALYAVLGFQLLPLSCINIGKVGKRGFKLSAVADHILSGGGIAGQQTVAGRALQHGKSQNGRGHLQVLTANALLRDRVDACIQTVENPKTENDQRDDDNDG